VRVARKPVEKTNQLFRRFRIQLLPTSHASLSPAPLESGKLGL
jgi:hypothetical protein